MNLNKLLVIAIFCTLLSCKKPKKTEEILEVMPQSILILNEGLFQQNNSSITQISKETNTPEQLFFEKKTGRGLGDTGNDLKRYGSKIYIVVNVSSTIEVIDAAQGSSLKKISMINGLGAAKQPRAITFSNGKGYVSCFDGFVDVLDTNTLTIVKRIQVGKNPDHICSNEQFVFTSNSGGLDFPLLDSTISVIDPILDVEISKKTVGKNPGVMNLDEFGYLFVAIRGNYSSITPKFLKLNSNNLDILSTENWNISKIERWNTKLLLVRDWGSFQSVVLCDPLTVAIMNTNFLETSSITKLYNLQVNYANGKIYCTDAKNFSNQGEVSEYSAQGAFVQKWKTGINPSKMLFVE
jgi:DNA-binding beta-propeller fold protein YncE